MNYYPTTLFIPGTSVRTNVLRWEVRSGRVTVVHLDGLRVRSGLTPSELESMSWVRPCECGEHGANRDCPAHGDGN